MTSSPETDQYPPVAVPRSLVFLASGWLFGSWVLAVGLRPPIQPSSLVFEPSARLFLASIVLGILVAWPLLRLSGPRQPRSRIATGLDLISLVVLIQIVLWPLRLMTSWSVEQTALIDALLVGWVILGGAFIAAAIPRGPVVRVAAMSSLLAWLIIPLPVAFTWSPLGMIWDTTAVHRDVVEEGRWLIAIWLWGLGGLLWATSDLWRVRSGTLKPS